jgi:hypothetical protein
MRSFAPCREMAAEEKMKDGLGRQEAFRGRTIPRMANPAAVLAGHVHTRSRFRFGVNQGI